MKKNFALITATIALPLMFAACNGKDPQSSQKKVTEQDSKSMDLANSSPEAVVQWLSEQRERYNTIVAQEVELQAELDEKSELLSQKQDQYEHGFHPGRALIFSGGSMAVYATYLGLAEQSWLVDHLHRVNGSLAKERAAMVALGKRGDAIFRAAQDQVMQTGEAAVNAKVARMTAKAEAKLQEYMKTPQYREFVYRNKDLNPRETLARFIRQNEEQMNAAKRRLVERRGYPLSRDEVAQFKDQYLSRASSLDDPWFKQNGAKSANLRFLAYNEGHLARQTMPRIQFYKESAMVRLGERAKKVGVQVARKFYHERVDGVVANARKLGAKPISWGVAFVGTGFAAGVYLAYEGSVALSSTRQELETYQAQVNEALEKVKAAKEEARSFLQASIEAAEAQGIDISAYDGGDEELDAMVEALVKHLQDNVPELKELEQIREEEATSNDEGDNSNTITDESHLPEIAAG